MTQQWQKVQTAAVIVVSMVAVISLPNDSVLKNVDATEVSDQPINSENIEDLPELYFDRDVAKNEPWQHEAAIADLDQAIKLDPNDADAYYNRGNEKAQLFRQQKAAIADLDQAIKLNPNHAKAYNNRGVIKNELRQHKAAIADLDQAIKLNPNHARVYHNRGVAKHSLEQYEAAIADYDQAIKLNPNTVTYYNRGRAKQKLRQYKAAHADFEQAIKFKPNHADTLQ